ncbi:MAG: selenoneine biosynthesis selenosugar synthase SenB [Burkholderiales bacterium]|nr:selenoneine biosynthesis selenosugar synthase SenB [Burkholderiales bacterium]
MNITIVTPAGARSRYGNRNTAARWAQLLRELGHRVVINVEWDGAATDMMIALHARRSHESIRRFALRYPDHPLIVALTGTDLYRDIRQDATARESMRLATRMIVLQDMGLRELSPGLRRKTRVIYQSTRPIFRQPHLKSCYEITVSGHLREEKDPFRAAAALSGLPQESRIRLTHIGGARTPQMAAIAQGWADTEPRYRWLGERAHGKALRLLARSRLMVISSLMEGGANVVSEALAAGVPVIASRIPGNIGMLGADYAGYFQPGNEKALARLLWRAESDAAFYRRLKKQCLARKPLVSPAREKHNLKMLLDELA